MIWLIQHWMPIAVLGLWTHMACHITGRRAHRVGWYRGYLAREHEGIPGELWPQGVSEQEGLRRAKMLKRST